MMISNTKNTLGSISKCFKLPNKFYNCAIFGSIQMTLFDLISHPKLNWGKTVFWCGPFEALYRIRSCFIAVIFHQFHKKCALKIDK